MRASGIVAIALAAIAVGASSTFAEAPATPEPVMIGQPDWLRRPSAEDIEKFYPASAAAAGGTAELQCRVTARGTLDGCEVTAESPAGRGVGAAALALASIFVMRPAMINGQPVGGATVRIPIRFGAGQSAPSITVSTGLAWEQTPTAEDVTAAFPAHPKGGISEGHVLLRCRVKKDRSLTSCDVTSEDPRGSGFGAAARGLAGKFKVSQDDPTMRRVRELYVDLPFDFRSLGGPPTEIYDPTWLKGPDPQMAGKLFPLAAITAGYRTGLGIVQCTVRHDGGLSDCTVVGEDPPELGFGEVALAAAKVMTMNPWTKQGLPVDGAKIRMPIRLNLDPNQVGSVPGPPPSSYPAPMAIVGDGARTCSGRTASEVNAASKAGKTLDRETCGLSHATNLPPGLATCRGLLGGAHAVAGEQKAAGCKAMIGSGRLAASQMAEVYDGLADANATREDHTESLADAGSAIAWDPQSSFAWAKACSLHTADDIDRARYECATALKLAPDLVEGLTFRGDIYLQQRNYTLAIADYDEAIRRKPDWMWPWTNRGAAKMRSGKLADARHDLDTAVQLSPDWAMAHIIRGQIEILQKELGSAASDFAASVALDPKCAACLYGRGVVKVLDRDPSGVADLAKARELDSTIDQAFSGAGIAPPAQGGAAHPSRGSD